MAQYSAPLFSELGFSKELYEIRQKNGRYLLGAAWLLEVIAASIGLLIAIILILQGQETLREVAGEITSSMRYSVYISGLPFVMSAVVELMKIPMLLLSIILRVCFGKVSSSQPFACWHSLPLKRCLQACNKAIK